MTERLYYHDSYLATFTALVTEVTGDGRRVYLDQTALYPTSGGQPNDLGTLDGIPVVDVLDEGDRIAHLLAAPLAAGSSVTGAIDWPRRFDHMQQHTGQHLLSAVLADLTGAATVAVHFGDATNTVDLELAALSPAELGDVEDRANSLVTADLAVSVSFQDADDAIGLRKESARTGTLRIVTIEGIDRSACGGTHVRRTGEIGLVQLRRIERVKQRMRVEFVCGGRAVRRARADLRALSRIAATLSASLDDAPTLVAQAREDAAALRHANEKLAAEVSEGRARALYAAATPDASGRRFAAVQVREGVDSLRPLALAMAELDGAIFVGTATSPPAVIVSAAATSGYDAGSHLKRALGAVGGRGGGSPRLAQGSVPRAEDLEAVAMHLMAPDA